MKKSFTPDRLPLKDLDWMVFLDLIGPAHDAVARFDGLIQSIPNPAVLLSPLTTQEAVLSSRIEGTQATVKEVLEYEANPKDTNRYQDIQEVLNYRKAMLFAIGEMEKIGFTLRLLRQMHERLLDSVRGEHKNPGNFRKSDVYIGPEDKPEAARYVPPTWQTLDAHLKNFETYANDNDKDIIVQLAIIHAQFEIIHPFADGNGRMGRIILPLFLNFKGVLSRPMLYLSAYFETHRDDYYAALQNISDKNDWESWIRYFLQAVISQTNQNIDKAKEIQRLYEQQKNRIRDLTNSKYAIDTLDQIFKTPIFNSAYFKSQSRIPYASASRILSQLVKGKVLHIIQKGAGKRATTYSFRKLLDIVES